MARIAGVDIPKNKRGVIALTYIFGIGSSRAKDILEKANVSEDKKVQDWNDDEIGAIRDAVSYYKIEGELRSEISLKHQTFNGYRMLQRNPSQSWSSVKRTKN
jgi:small subunit ribosomal protein S13